MEWAEVISWTLNIGGGGFDRRVALGSLGLPSFERGLSAAIDRSIRELSKGLNIPYGMLYREVKNLVSLGILNQEKRGKVTLISANNKLPYFAELRGMMMKTAGLGDLMRNSLSGVKGIRYALIYGSFASGEEAESSDIDLLVVGDLSEEDVLKAVSRVERGVGREVNYILWSETEFSRRVRSRHHLLVDIARKPVVMLIGDEDEFRRAAEK